MQHIVLLFLYYFLINATKQLTTRKLTLKLFFDNFKKIHQINNFIQTINI
jgi:hypothetical protein